MAFPWNDDKNAEQTRKPSRGGGRTHGGCPWAQDDDEDMFQRGPPSSRGTRGNRNKSAHAAPVPVPRSPYKPGVSGAPWAADQQQSWDKPANSYGAGVGADMGAPPNGADYGGYYGSGADPLPDEIDYGYAPQPTASMPVGRSPQRGGGGGAPWAQDNDEPMMTVSQAAFRGGNMRSAPPSRGHNAPALSAKEMKAKMQGAGNLLSWN